MSSTIELLKNPDYPEGSLLMDVRYVRKPECYEVIIWNSITQRPEVYYEECIIDIWFLKEEYRTNKYQLPQIEKDKCYPVYCKPSQVLKMIAEHIGGHYKEFYEHNKDMIHQKDYKNHMLECPWVFKADLLPDVYYRLNWIWKHGNSADISHVETAFLDIEVDVIDKSIDLKNIYDVTQPVNAVTLILPKQKICAVFILGPRPKHKIHSKFHDLLEKQQKDFDWLCSHQDEFKRMIIEEDPENKQYIGDFDIRLHIFDFNREIDLIKTIFDYINKYRPWFCASWNAAFDDNYLTNRISYLGYSPKDIMIPAEFKTDKIYYQEDTNPNATPKSAKDWFYLSSYTQLICQMKNYALLRKSQQEKGSYSLSAIGKDEAGIDKIGDKKSGTFRQFAYTDFITFILYNIRDVVVQYAVELNTGDMGGLYARSYGFATQYSKCFQETHIVRNCREFFFEKLETPYLQACRLKIDPNIDSHFKGAFVAPPEKNKKTGLYINGKAHNNIIFGAVDADAASYYPSSKMGMNQDPMSLLYKCIVDNNQYINREIPNKSLNQEYWWWDSATPPQRHAEDMAGPILNSFKNGNIMSVLYNWTNMPSVSEIFEYIDNNI